MRSITPNRIMLALAVNAVILVIILLTVISRDGRLFSGSVALGQYQVPAQPSLSTAGITIMPGQLSPNTWGCYVIDPQNQTLSVYQFSPGEHNLKLAASRDIEYDRKLKMFNTSPDPLEIKALLERADEPVRGATAPK